MQKKPYAEPTLEKQAPLIEVVEGVGQLVSGPID